MVLGINVRLVRFTPRARAVLLPKPELPVAQLEGDKGSLGHLFDILYELLECDIVGWLDRFRWSLVVCLREWRICFS